MEAINYGALQYWVGHYEGKLPRRENYKKKTLTHLEKLEKKLTLTAGMFRDLLAREGHGEDLLAKELMAVYEYHHRAAVIAIAAKTGKLKAA